MAVQLPNFLGVPVRTPDYSGLGDIVNNFYAGKAMPKDDLIKAIQAEFARPNAEQSLLAAQLGNKKTGLDIRKGEMDIQNTLREVAQQKMLEDELRKALTGAGAPGAMPADIGAMAGSAPAASPVGSPMQSPLPSNGGMAPMNQPVASPLNVGGQQTQSPQQTAAPLSVQPTPSPVESPMNEITVTKGSPHLAAIDAMYENSPLSRAFLEKKGFKKHQEIKFDNKTGKTSVITKYPSGRITVQSAGGVGSTGEAPLTSKMVSKHQNIVSSVDVALPVLKDLANMGSYPRQGIYRGGQYGDYQGKVSQAIDSVLGAFGLPMTNEGLKTIRDQIEIKTFETPSHYKKRMEKLIEDLKARQKYSANEVKKTLKNPPVDNESNQSYSSDEWDEYND